MRRFFQIRNNDRPADQRLYSVFDEATGVSVKRDSSGREARLSFVFRPIDLLILENTWHSKGSTVLQTSAVLTDE